jgi:hypothetical protein
MSDWPDPKGEPVTPILERLCAADDLKEPVATMRRCLADELSPEEIAQGLDWLCSKGVVTIADGWVYLSRSSIKAALRVELGLP